MSSIKKNTTSTTSSAKPKIRIIERAKGGFKNLLGISSKSAKGLEKAFTPPKVTPSVPAVPTTKPAKASTQSSANLAAVEKKKSSKFSPTGISPIEASSSKSTTRTTSAVDATASTNDTAVDVTVSPNNIAVATLSAAPLEKVAASHGPTSSTSTQVNEHPANDKPAVVDKPTISVEPTSKILSRAYEWRWTCDRCDDKPQKQAYNTREQAKAGIPTCNNCLTPKTAGLGKLYILKKRDGPLKPIQSEPTQSGPTQSEPTMNQSEPTQSDPNHSVPQSVPQSEPTQSEATQSKPSQANPTTKVSFNTPSKKPEDTAAVGKSGNVFNDTTPKDSGIIPPSRDSAHTTGGNFLSRKSDGTNMFGYGSSSSNTRNESSEPSKVHPMLPGGRHTSKSAVSRPERTPGRSALPGGRYGSSSFSLHRPQRYLARSTRHGMHHGSSSSPLRSEGDSTRSRFLRGRRESSTSPRRPDRASSRDHYSPRRRTDHYSPSKGESYNDSLDRNSRPTQLARDQKVLYMTKWELLHREELERARSSATTNDRDRSFVVDEVLEPNVLEGLSESLDGAKDYVKDSVLTVTPPDYPRMMAEIRARDAAAATAEEREAWLALDRQPDAYCTKYLPTFKKRTRVDDQHNAKIKKPAPRSMHDDHSTSQVEKINAKKRGADDLEDGEIEEENTTLRHSNKRITVFDSEYIGGNSAKFGSVNETETRLSPTTNSSTSNSSPASKSPSRKRSRDDEEVDSDGDTPASSPEPESKKPRPVGHDVPELAKSAAKRLKNAKMTALVEKQKEQQARTKKAQFISIGDIKVDL